MFTPDAMDLHPLIAPRSIAVVGASERSGLGRWILDGLAVFGFDGGVYPVNISAVVMTMSCLAIWAAVRAACLA